MPIYEYVCAECNQASEILVKNREMIPHCPHCNSKRLEKQISVPGAVIISKGSKIKPCGKSQSNCEPLKNGCAFPGSCCGRDT